MPSPHSSDETQADARAIAANLGADDRSSSRSRAPMAAYERSLAAHFDGHRARPRRGEPAGPDPRQPVMALSNKFGWLVLTTGNKSEMAVGYATLYGDMAGGFAVIKDVPKRWSTSSCGDRNGPRGRELVPASVLERPPSAELRPDQRDDRLAAALRGARPHPRGLRRGRPAAASDLSPTASPEPTSSTTSIAPGRPRRVQAPPGAARASGSRPRPSAATAACRSPTGSGRASLRYARRADARSSSATWRRGGPRRRSSRRPRPRSCGRGGGRGRGRGRCPR